MVVTSESLLTSLNEVEQLNWKNLKKTILYTENIQRLRTLKLLLNFL